MLLLSPVQLKAYQGLLDGIRAGSIALLKGRACSGKTTILAQLSAANGGVLLGMRQFIDSVAAGAPFAIEEGFLRMIEEALATYELVIVDDLHLVTRVTHNYDYARAYLLDAALTALLGDAAFLKKKLVFGTAGEAPWPILRRAVVSEIGERRVSRKRKATD